MPGSDHEGTIDYTALFEMGSALFAIADPSGVFLRVNDAWEAVLGYPRAELEGSAFLELIHPDDIADTVAQLTLMRASHDVAGFINRYRHRDGSYRHIEWNASSQGDLIYATASDVTRRIRAQEELEQSRQLHKTLFDITGQGVVYQDATGRITHANPAALRMLGLTWGQVTGRTSMDPRWRSVREDWSNFPGEEHPAMVALRTGQEISGVIMGVYHPVTDQYRWIRIRSVPLFEGDADHPHMVSTTFDDITWSRATEQRMRAQNESLRQAIAEESAARSEAGNLMAALDRHAIVSTTDLQGTITHVNDNFCRVSGYDREELIGATHRKISSGLHPPEFFREMWRTITRGETWSGEICNRTKSGTPYWVLSTIHPFTDSRGRLTRFISIRTDVTALKEAQLAAQEASRAKSSFLANMSHEIRTPLTSIIGLSTLADVPTLDSSLAETMAQIRQSGEHLLSMLNDVLDFERIDAAHVQLRREPFSLRAQVDQVLAMYRDQAEGKGLRLESDWDGDLPSRCIGDPVRLRQILLNLISNSVKLTREGSVRLTVSDRGEDASGGRLIGFRVSDTGPGVAAADSKLIFEPFAQADESLTRTVSGTGLGLPISARLVEMLGGELVLESNTESGAAFNFTLPFPLEHGEDERPDSGQAEKRQARPPIPDQPSRAGQESSAQLAGTVLLVEDNAVNRLIAVRMLQRLGLTVVEAGDGAEAVGLATDTQSPRFDAVLMDVHLPLVDGWAATRMIRESPGGGSVPIVALTANALTGDRERSLDAGMDDHITKPFRITDLARVLGRWLGKEAHDPLATGTNNS